MTEERRHHLARLAGLRRRVAVGALAVFGAFFGLAAEHAVGSGSGATQGDSTTPAQQQQQQQQSDDGFFDDGGDQSGGFGFGGTAPQTPPAGQSRVS